MAGKFAVYRDKSGRYRFHAKAGNGQTVATGPSKRSTTERTAAPSAGVNEPQAGRAGHA